MKFNSDYVLLIIKDLKRELNKERKPNILILITGGLTTNQIFDNPLIHDHFRIYKDSRRKSLDSIFNIVFRI